MNTAHNENMSLLNLLDPTVRALLVDLAHDDVLDWLDTDAANFERFGAEFDALCAMTDLTEAQWRVIATAAWDLAQEGTEFDPDCAITAH
jgi:hypothetical protein